MVVNVVSQRGACKSEGGESSSMQHYVQVRPQHV